MDLYGFKVISEMTKEEMIEELLIEISAQLHSMDTNQLKKHVIRDRVSHVQNRLIAEAQLDNDEPPSLFDQIFGQP